jgi:hypothetical protein
VKDLSEIDKQFLEDYSKLLYTQEKVFEQLKDYTFSESKTEITEAIITRMKTYDWVHEKIKIFLGKKQKQASADFFVESVLFFLKSYLSQKRPDLTVLSEKQVWHQGRKNIRPDIVIEKGNKVVGIIECKVQLGRKRVEWKNEIEKRENLLKHHLPDALFTVLCLHEGNWQGFEKDERFGTKYFSLLDGGGLWNGKILTPIENLFARIEKL